MMHTNAVTWASSTVMVENAIDATINNAYCAPQYAIRHAIRREGCGAMSDTTTAKYSTIHLKKLTDAQ